MTEISIENQIDKNQDDKSPKEEISYKQTPIQNSDLIKNEIKPNDNIIDDSSVYQSKEDKPKKCKLYMFVGRTIFLFFDKYSNPIFIIGPQWPMVIFVTSLISSLMLFLYILNFGNIYPLEQSFLVQLIFGLLFYLMHIQVL